MKIIEAKNYEFEYEGDKFCVYSHPAFDGNGLIVRLVGPLIDLVVRSRSRGEAIIEMADFLKGLGYRLAKEAFEQEGAVKVPK